MWSEITQKVHVTYLMAKSLWKSSIGYQNSEPETNSEYMTFGKPWLTNREENIPPVIKNNIVMQHNTTIL